MSVKNGERPVIAPQMYTLGGSSGGWLPLLLFALAVAWTVARLLGRQVPS